jgi:indoleamine 2,3-dioxygenase
MKWTLQDRGFLPNQDPVASLSDTVFQKIERLGTSLPRLVHDQSFREASAAALSPPLDWDSVLPATEDAEVEHLFKLFSYFASAYVHAPGMPPVAMLPSYLAVPLVRLAQIVERPPILSYASYCLHNWRRLDPGGPVALGNLELLQNFSVPEDGKKDEDWFILVHVDIEARAGEALKALQKAPEVLSQDDPETLSRLLETSAGSMVAMNATLARMPERCSPDVYFRKVRPYIFGFTNLIYEGCLSDVPQSYRGETGAQSAIVPTLLAALGIQHKDSLLTKHLQDMRNYMPAPHRDFIRAQASVREHVKRFATGANAQGKRLRDLYNDCVRQLVAFRSKHFEYAVNYIEKKVANPIATGGTPYVPWLHQMIEETKEYFLPP